MSRDHRRLRVFTLADGLVVDVYRVSRAFPVEERFGLQGQLRRAAVSAACNIVEGCARTSSGEYRHFLNVASASATEARYLIELASRLDFLTPGQRDALMERYRELIARIQALVRAIRELP